MAGVAFAFDAVGTLLRLDPSGSVTAVDGEPVADFEIDGSVDIFDGFDVANGAATFTVLKDGGGVAVPALLVGDVATGEIDVVARCDPNAGRCCIR